MNRKNILLIIVTSIVSATTSFVIIFFMFHKENIEITNLKDDDYYYASNEIEQNENNRYPDLTYAAENTVPAVVNIENIRIVKRSNEHYGRGYDPFSQLFGMPQGRRQSTPQEQRSGGSGVIISEDGYIITNNHVIEGASELKITLSDGRSFEAKLVGADPTTDIALVKIEAGNLSFIEFGDSGKLRLGEWLVAVGNPYGLNSTVTAGIVSAKGRDLNVIPGEFRLESFIQTDAAVNPGNSGGALVNTKGELVGINTVIKSPTGSYAGYSFAVPSIIVNKIVVDLMEYGIVQRAMLGVGYTEITDEFLEQYGNEIGVQEKKGLYISSVDPNGAAAEAGVEKGDVLIAINNVQTNRSTHLQEEIVKFRPNETVNISVKRDGKVKHFEVLLRNKIGEAKLLDRNSEGVIDFLGGEFRNLDQRKLKSLDIKHGVQVVKLGNELLFRAGIREGYIITHINGSPISKVSDLSKLTQRVETIDGLYPNGRYISYYSAEK